MAESHIKIEGIHPTLDGDYPFDLGALTNRDLHDIKRLSGVRSQELMEAFDAGDTDLFVAFAVIALRHAGKPKADDAIWDAEFGNITFVAGDEEEQEVLPPASAPPSETPSERGGQNTQPDEASSSGSGSSSSVVGLVSVPSPTGTPPSDTGATSPLEMSGT